MVENGVRIKADDVLQHLDVGFTLKQTGLTRTIFGTFNHTNNRKLKPLRSEFMEGTGKQGHIGTYICRNVVVSRSRDTGTVVPSLVTKGLVSEKDLCKTRCRGPGSSQQKSWSVQ